MHTKPHGHLSEAFKACFVSTNDLASMLQTMDLFKHLSAQEKQQLSRYTKAYHVAAEQTIMLENDPQGYMCIIVQGQVDIIKQTDNGPKQLTQLGPGKTFGEMSLLDGHPFSATATTTEDCQLIVLTTQACERLSEDNPVLALRFTRQLAQVMSQRLRQTTDMLTICLTCVADLTVALNSATETSLNKTQFLAEVSHELRTPLNAILGYSELLEETAVDLGHQDYAADANRIHYAGEHLLGLINNLLDVSKVEAGKMDLFLADFPIHALINSIAVTLKPDLAKNHNTLHLSSPDDIGDMFADETKVTQCLLNLMSNACKFTQNGAIQLQVTSIFSDNHEWILFQVSDNGIGMEKEQLEHLFQPYVQGDKSISHRFGGTGLGLAIAFAFSQLMGGSLSVQSEPHQGTAFTLRIPRRVAAITQDE